MFYSIWSIFFDQKSTKYLYFLFFTTELQNPTFYVILFIILQSIIVPWLLRFCMCFHEKKIFPIFFTIDNKIFRYKQLCETAYLKSPIFQFKPVRKSISLKLFVTLSNTLHRIPNARPWHYWSSIQHFISLQGKHFRISYSYVRVCTSIKP